MASDTGLCGKCVHRVEVRNTRGSVFSLCARSRTDPSYPRYPRLPVLECAGYERTLAGGGGAGGVADGGERRAKSG
ncbi:MAG TPA: hypothetical protein VL972_01685 [Solirubrobacteraceae bacterium]|nr:hypothetical protein [Solirubrobacteraceae bacterium]